MSLNNLSKVLAAAAQDVVFSPTADMRRAKAAFWSNLSDHPLGDGDSLSLTAAKELGADPRLSKWWTLPGFQEWWQNKQEFKQRLEYLAQLALDSLEQVLGDPDSNATAKINAARLVMDAANKMPKPSSSQDNLDQKLASMSRAELESFVRSRVKYLTPPTEVDTVSSTVGVSTHDAETRIAGSSSEGDAD